MLLPPTASHPQALTVVHGHRVHGGHRLWVASRVTIARLWVGRVGRVPAGQDRRLPIAPLGWRVQGVAVLIRRGCAGVGHGHSRAEGRPQQLGPEMEDKKSSHECLGPAHPTPVQVVSVEGDSHSFSQSWGAILCPQAILPIAIVPLAHQLSPCPSPSHQLSAHSPPCAASCHGGRGGTGNKSPEGSLGISGVSDEEQGPGNSPVIT